MDGLTKEELGILRSLVDDVIYASTKAEAKAPAQRLASKASQLNGKLDPYLRGKLSEVIAYAKDASGQPRSKEHWISCVEQCRYVFENGAGKR